MLPSVENGGCAPSSGLPAKGNATEAARASHGWKILLLLSTGHDSEIRSAIVEPIAVDVIDLQRIAELETDERSVHQNNDSAGPPTGIAAGSTP